ncbi:acyl carrier protein [Nocardia cyriacigeorgica]|jgi:acyl carrier protein|uniref:Acyl carrier protein AcpXL n=1 Tax=Nocardia cyriacigeorgica TaxID=135487 RepID=A0A2L2JS86_9NOCA|nr:acyl carrier protein [Nocardia cyriacigeorgica]AVH22696.1 acyl carrier protein [Nocardia cyriacigeorgica]MBF6086945.1 acyl carrier protein [Nocardia cyriacigeorgica]MBF6090732.1 acyl carrier protein [Nocardia cyriacigeorgica]MBF6101691.1 acyl carrier protein [Nocardia cyriacigeorgica]MBF6158950.1 acyl carrier protein [Nocardia cyriacigeorgica]
MTEITAQTLQAVREAVAEAVGIDVDEAEPDATVLGELGAESIDLLDILFRIERKVGVKIQAAEIAELLQGELSDEEFEDADGRITPAGREQLARALPQLDPSTLPATLTADQVMTLFTVRNLAEMATARAAITADAS